MPKPPGRVRNRRARRLGDVRWGVNDADTFCSQLENDLRTQHPGVDLEVVNLGVPGYATRQEVALLKRNLADLQPDVVLVGFLYQRPARYARTTRHPAARAHGSRRPTGGLGQVLRMKPGAVFVAGASGAAEPARVTASHGLKALIHRGEGKPGSSMELDLLESRSSGDLETAWQNVTTQLED
jgi:hypothetical protein